MPIPIKIETIEIGATPRHLRKRIRAILRAGWEKVGKFTVKKIFPKHFTHAGAKEYGYTRRQGDQFPFQSREWRRSYQGRKWRRFKHTNPLQNTGVSKFRTQHNDVRPGPKGDGVYVPWHAPAFNFRPRGGRIDMRKEMAAISAADVRAVTEIMDRHKNRAMKLINDRTVVVRKVA